MDLVEIIERVYNMMMLVDSFEIDPDRENTIMEENDSFVLKKSVDRALRWLKDKIFDAKVDPIIVTLESPGDSYQAIVDALADRRSGITIREI